MTKKGALGGNVFIAGYDLSGDIASLESVSGGPVALEVRGMNKLAPERIGGVRDGGIGFTTWFNDASDQEHDALKGLPTADVQIQYHQGTTLGDAVAALIGKQVNYDGTPEQDGGFSFAVQAVANAKGLEWCQSLTAGKRTDGSATNGSSIDRGMQGAAVTITSSSVDNPTNILCAAVHGLATGDTIVIAGHTGATPDLNNEYVVTVVDTTNFTIPENVSVGGAGGTMTKTNNNFGLSAYLQVTEFTGTSVTGTIEESFDDGVGDAFSAVTGGAFAAVSSANSSERIETTAALTVYRYLRLVTSGTFSDAKFACCVIVHQVSTLPH